MITKGMQRGAYIQRWIITIKSDTQCLAGIILVNKQLQLDLWTLLLQTTSTSTLQCTHARTTLYFYVYQTLFLLIKMRFNVNKQEQFCIETELRILSYKTVAVTSRFVAGQRCNSPTPPHFGCRTTVRTSYLSNNFPREMKTLRLKTPT